MIWTIAAATAFIAIAYYIFVKEHRPKTLSIYSNGGKYYWLKYWLFLGILRLRRRKLVKEREHESDNDRQKAWERVEAKQTLPNNAPHAVDAVYFNASNSDGHYFAVGTAQRQNNVMNAFFILKVPGIGLLQNIEMPLTNLPSDDVPGAYCAKGILVKCVEPMRKWQITYHGLLQRNQDKKALIKGTIKLTWTATSQHFNFDTDSSDQCIARSVAKEQWSREMFARLKATHQTHYEQFGNMQGTIELDGYDTGHVNMISMRDHTVGNHRDWAELRRYIMTIFHLVDGTCIHTSVISMPGVVFSSLEIGYMVTPDKQVQAVDSISLDLWQVGEDAKVPDTFDYSFTAGGKKYNVHVKIVAKSAKFPMGSQEGAIVYENLAEFTCNGIFGYGITEWEYCKDF